MFNFCGASFFKWTTGNSRKNAFHKNSLRLLYIRQLFSVSTCTHELFCRSPPCMLSTSDIRAFVRSVLRLPRHGIRQIRSLYKCRVFAGWCCYFRLQITVLSCHQLIYTLQIDMYMYDKFRIWNQMTHDYEIANRKSRPSSRPMLRFLYSERVSFWYFQTSSFVLYDYQQNTRRVFLREFMI